MNTKKFLSLYDFHKFLYFHAPAEAMKDALGLLFTRSLQEPLDLDNPVTFNEKIQYVKLIENDNRKTILTDKFLVRGFVKDTIGDEYLVPLLGVYKSFDEIDFEQLPQKFILKCNHGCGWNMAIDKSKINLDIMKQNFDTWLNTNYAFFAIEMQYFKIRPRIIAEKYLENHVNDLFDYKFWCFSGDVKLIQFVSGRNKSYVRNFYDLDWNPRPDVYGKNYYKPKARPKSLDEMIALAKKLSKDFNFVRVDLYEVENKIYFGEMTFTPMGGLIKFADRNLDIAFGNLIHL